MMLMLIATCYLAAQTLFAVPPESTTPANPDGSGGSLQAAFARAVGASSEVDQPQPEAVRLIGLRYGGQDTMGCEASSMPLSSSVKQAYGVEASALDTTSLHNLGEANMTPAREGPGACPPKNCPTSSQLTERHAALPRPAKSATLAGAPAPLG